MLFSQLRKAYHTRICTEIVRISAKTDGYPNFADKASRSSRQIAWHLLHILECQPQVGNLPGQTVGKRFEQYTMEFLRDALELLQHLRPGRWEYQLERKVSTFVQYAHLHSLDELVTQHKELASVLGHEHIIKPDITIARLPLSDEEINQDRPLISDDIATHTPLRETNNALPLLHASISCKWTIRHDRSQNTRAEALNLIRHRKGHTPHIVAITAEPLPTRIAALALGTGDVDCVYHFALYELEKAIEEVENEDQLDMLHTLVEGHRLRDISDLPLDLIA